tara:strand:- start:4381 stop:5256 length:876 start_codon:yes stop_codon:yes gene_type:complete
MGGLGNQLFQYSFARAFSLRNGFRMKYDPYSLFINSIYNNKYELKYFPIKADRVSNLGIIKFFLFRIFRKLLSKRNIIYKNKLFIKLYGELLMEENNKFDLKFMKREKISDIDCVGYFQSYKYFEEFKDNILDETTPITPSNSDIVKLGKIIGKQESVSVGLRFFEEDQKFKKNFYSDLELIQIINKVIIKLRNKLPKVRFFIFCSYNNPYLSKLLVPSSTNFITGDNELYGATETLWLISKCKHHIFTPSTFYWWGAWLSQRNHDVSNQLIFAQDHLYMPPIPKSWSKFK